MKGETQMIDKLNRKLKKKKLREFVLILIILGIFLGFAIIVFFAKIDNVTVVGCEFYTEEEIKEKVMKNIVTQNSIGLYLTYQLQKDTDIPFVEKIDVNIISWDSVEILIYEKAMVACIKYMGEYLYFDRDGVIVESATEPIENVPLIEGVTFQKMNLHEKLEVKEEGIFEKILGISQLLSKYKLDLDKVAFEYDKSVTLYTGKIRVKLGKKERYDEQIAELSKLLPEAQKKKLKGVLNMENFEEGQNQVILQVDE